MNLERAPGCGAMRSASRSVSQVADRRHHLAARDLVLRLPVGADRSWKA
jgi:hypothetical protein